MLKNIVIIILSLANFTLMVFGNIKAKEAELNFINAEICLAEVEDLTQKLKKQSQLAEQAIAKSQAQTALAMQQTDLVNKLRKICK